MVQIVRFYELGGPEVLKIEEVATREPQEGEVRINVAAFGLNRAETLFREGRYLERPAKFPCQLGYEASGVIDAIGQNVDEFKIGDKVSTIPAFSMSKYGVYGTSAIVPAKAVAHYPNNLTFEQATSIWMQYLTAYGALIGYSHIQAGDNILITAASSSVGYAAIQLVKLAGANAIACTRTAKKKQMLLNAGANHVIVTDEEDLVEQVMKITSKKGVNIIFDPIAGSLLQTLAKAAAHGGVIYEYGALSLEPTHFPLFAALQKALTVRGYTLFEMTSDPQKLSEAKKYVCNALQAGKLKPVIDKIFPLSQIADAHRYMESNQQNGKIVVTTGAIN